MPLPPSPSAVRFPAIVGFLVRHPTSALVFLIAGALLLAVLLTERPLQPVTAQFASPTLDGLVWCQRICPPANEFCAVEVFSHGSEPIVEAVDG